MADSPKTSRRTLYLLLALFFAPLAASFILYYGASWRPAGGTNHGELLEPIRLLPPLQKSLQGKWALVHVGEGACTEAYYAGIVIVDVTDPAARAAVLEVLPSENYANDLFVIDPQQNVVLRFDARENPKGLLTDLKKLLKLSHIG